MKLIWRIQTSMCPTECNKSKQFSLVTMILKSQKELFYYQLACLLFSYYQFVLYSTFVRRGFSDASNYMGHLIPKYHIFSMQSVHCNVFQITKHIKGLSSVFILNIPNYIFQTTDKVLLQYFKRKNMKPARQSIYYIKYKCQLE